MSRLVRTALPATFVAATLISIALTGHHRTAVAIDRCALPAGQELLSPSEREMLDAINHIRYQHNLDPLKPSLALNRAAAWKSHDSSAGPGAFGHTDSLGRGATERANDCGYPHPAGENIAYGYDGPGETLDAWMDSPSHRVNILGEQYVVIGIGKGPGDEWTTNFGFVDDNGTTVSASVPEPVRVDLQPGMNTVTYHGARRPIGEAFASVRAQLVAVYYWDAAAGRWLRYFPGLPGYATSLWYVESETTYLVLVDGPGTLVYER